VTGISVHSVMNAQALDWRQRQVRFWERSHRSKWSALWRAMLKEKKNLIKYVQKYIYIYITIWSTIN